MTDQSPNAQFHASSFLDGANADYVDQLQARYASDPNSVDAAWAEFFRALGDSEIDAKRGQVTAGVQGAEAMYQDARTQAERIRGLYRDSAATRAQAPGGQRLPVGLNRPVVEDAARQIAEMRDGDVALGDRF